MRFRPAFAKIGSDLGSKMVHPASRICWLSVASWFPMRRCAVAEAQGEPDIKPDRVLDDFGREAVAAIADLGHHRWLRLKSLNGKPAGDVTMPVGLHRWIGPRRTMMPISLSSSDGRPSTISHRLVIRRLSEKLDDHQPRCQHPRNTLIDVASNDRRGRGSCCG
jgi:hypothetical protein